jgi:asparagine synthase (glutamine-hydrolysing)
MCGICGIVNTDRGRLVSSDQLVAMRDTMVHRGPDDAGVMVEGHVGLAHRRLSILDLSERGHQPMKSSSKRFCVTYNGEIYNYRVLREELHSLGHDFRSDSDTEVLTEGLEAWGLSKLLSKLDGIFAFAAWDAQERQLVAARDHLGVKPFYYSWTPRQFLFASEVKALWTVGLARGIDPDALEELLIFRFVAGENTPFLGVKRLKPGHYLTLTQGYLDVRPYWRVVDHVGDDPACATRWRQRFRQAVSHQLISDVPVGTMLSGGLDSSTVTAEVARISDKPVQTFTVSIPPGEGLDEAPYAEAVAKRWNCVAHQVRVPGGDTLDRLRAAQAFHDEPFVLGNDLYIFELSRLAKQHVTVLLSGEGADETLGGYTRYEPIRHPALLKLGVSSLGAPLRHVLIRARTRSARRLGRLLSLGSLEKAMLYNSAHLHPTDLKEAGFATKEIFEVRRAILQEAETVTKKPIKQLMLYDTQTFLPAILNRNDGMTMSASIECRVPFLAVGVVEAALGLPVSEMFVGRYGKKVLREHAAELLPGEVLYRRKWGLGIPWGSYFRRVAPCREFVEKLSYTELARAMDAPGLPAVIRDFLKGDDTKFPLVYEVFSLAVWWEQVMIERTIQPGADNDNGAPTSSK